MLNAFKGNQSFKSHKNIGYCCEKIRTEKLLEYYKQKKGIFTGCGVVSLIMLHEFYVRRSNPFRLKLYKCSLLGLIPGSPLSKERDSTWFKMLQESSLWSKNSSVSLELHIWTYASQIYLWNQTLGWLLNFNLFWRVMKYIYLNKWR